MADRNQQIIDEFRANEGRVGGGFQGRTLLLLHHRGAKTGTERVNPLAYQRLTDDAVAVFATKGGSPKNPDWYHNLVANPEVAVEIGNKTFRARARVAKGEERERIWVRQKRDWPGFADYEARTRGIREIPVVVLEETQPAPAQRSYSSSASPAKETTTERSSVPHTSPSSSDEPGAVRSSVS